MKDIEQLLQQSKSPKPRRELSGAFTQRVMQRIAAPPEKGKREWWRRYLPVPALRRFPKPAAIGLLSLMLLAVGGSSYALVTYYWPDTSATLKTEIMLPSGNRIVAVDTDNCLGVQSLDGTAKPDGKSVKYYEVRHDSKYTNEEIVAMVQANCEENVSSNAVSAIIKERFGPMKKGSQNPMIMSGAGFVIKAIDDHRLTLGRDPHWFADDDKTIFMPDTTYTHIASDVDVHDRNQPITLRDLRPGDSVTVVVRDLHMLGSETDPNDHNHWDDPDLIVIEAILRVPTPSASTSLFYELIGVDIVRAEPCDSSPTGFCRAYEFIKDDLTKGVRTEAN